MLEKKTIRDVEGAGVEGLVNGHHHVVMANVRNWLCRVGLTTLLGLSCFSTGPKREHYGHAGHGSEQIEGRVKYLEIGGS